MFYVASSHEIKTLSELSLLKVWEMQLRLFPLRLLRKCYQLSR